MYENTQLRPLFIFALLCVAFIGCGTKKEGNVHGEQYPIYRSDTLSIELKKTTDTTVIIYRTEAAKVIVGYIALLKNLQEFIAQNNVIDDISLREKLTTMALETDSINVAGFESDSRLTERFQYRLADLLEEGQGIVIQDKAGARVKTVFVEHFEITAHKLAGRAGRRFYLPDGTLFLEVIDGIS